METTCGSLLSEMQKIWDEMGEPDIEIDKMLFELQQECLENFFNNGSFLTLKSTKNLKEELEAIKPQLEEMKRRKRERTNQYAAVVDQIQSISKELCLHFQENAQMSVIDENDFSVKRRLFQFHLFACFNICMF
ncbi:hypothetical protein CQW23_13895 [Capsicum baccatum]|uniref:65-kDa microtubule-associated protein 8 n=1 Tax=Capsicum baccatum TaxID=33114 RepID=A0A2G2WHK9_CAPBA|nr:hypothetical protein CQW23_13895 [Capsicum baccatum]